MLDSPVIEVAIGLTVVFLVLSLCATAVMEGLIEWRQWRGRLLHAKLRGLLGERLAERFYLDRRVIDLASGRAAPVGRLLQWMNRHGVLSGLRRWWRDSSVFTSTSRGQALALARSMEAARLPSLISDAVFADVIMDWLQGVELPAELHPDTAPASVIPERLARLWNAMNLRADGAQDALRREVVQWYRQSMERTTGEFKRRVRVVLYLVGALLVVGTNADTLRIATDLYRDPAIRAHYVSFAERVDAACPQGPTACPELSTAVEKTLNDPAAASAGLLGWTDQAEAAFPQAWPWFVLGWLLTVLAIGLGADFWFGALKRILTLRSSGTVRAETAAVAPQPDTPAPRTGEPRLPLDVESSQVAGLKGFQPLRYAESNVHAFWLAQLASLAYSDAGVLQGSAFLRNHRLSLQSFDRGGTQAFLFTGPELCILAFRGTEQALEDWLTDADVRHEVGPWGRTEESIAVHRGFHTALDQVWGDVLAAVTRVELPVWITGHSLGGALAMLAAYRMQVAESPAIQVAGVYTFGQPRVGNAAWSKSLPLALEQRVYRYINHNDIVPLVPPVQPVEYRHAGHARYFDASGRLHHGRTLWERIAEQLTPALGAVAGGDVNWSAAAKTHARDRFADHSMARYIECLERVDAVRALWPVDNRT